MIIRDSSGKRCNFCINEERLIREMFERNKYSGYYQVRGVKSYNHLYETLEKAKEQLRDECYRDTAEGEVGSIHVFKENCLVYIELVRKDNI